MEGMDPERSRDKLEGIWARPYPDWGPAGLSCLVYLFPERRQNQRGWQKAGKGGDWWFLQIV